MGASYSLQRCQELMATPWSVSINFSPPNCTAIPDYLLDCGVPFIAARQKEVPNRNTSDCSLTPTPNTATVTVETKTNTDPTTLTPAATVKFGWTQSSNQSYVRDRRQSNRANRRGGQAPPLGTDALHGTLTHLLGGSNSHNRWKIKLPSSGTYRCTVIVGDPSFPTVTTLAVVGDPLAPPTTAIENLSLPVGIQKEVVFDVTTNGLGELEIYNSNPSAEKKFAIKLSSIRFDMLGGNYDESFNNNDLKTFVLHLLQKQLYNEKELNALFGPHDEEEEQKKESQQKFGTTYQARSRQGLEDRGTSAMDAHLQELSATGGSCYLNENSSERTDVSGSSSSSSSTTEPSGDSSTSTTSATSATSSLGWLKGRTKTMSVLVTTLAHSTTHDIPMAVCGLEKRLLVLTRLLHDMMAGTTAASSPGEEPALYKFDASIKLITEGLNKLAKSSKSKNGSPPNDATCIQTLFNFGRLAHATKSNDYDFPKNLRSRSKGSSNNSSSSSSSKKQRRSSHSSKGAATTSATAATKKDSTIDRSLTNLMQYMTSNYKIKSQQTELLHIFQLCILGRSALVANESSRSHLRHPLGDLYPMGCIIPTLSHLTDLRATDTTGKMVTNVHV